MATVSFTRGSGTLPSIIDGQFVVNTSTGKVYLDNNTSRIELAPPPVTSVNGKTGAITIQSIYTPDKKHEAWVQDDFIGIACGEWTQNGEKGFSIRWGGNQGDLPAFVDTYDGWKGHFYGEFNKPTPAEINAVSKNGDTINGTLMIGSFLKFWSDSEGGNIRIFSSDDVSHVAEFDYCMKDGLRLYTSTDGGHSATAHWHFKENGNTYIPNQLIFRETEDASIRVDEYNNLLFYPKGGINYSAGNFGIGANCSIYFDSVSGATGIKWYLTSSGGHQFHFMSAPSDGSDAANGYWVDMQCHGSSTCPSEVYVTRWINGVEQGRICLLDRYNNTYKTGGTFYVQNGGGITLERIYNGNSARGISMWSDAEGGQFEIYNYNSTAVFCMDAPYDRRMRIYHWDMVNNSYCGEIQIGDGTVTGAVWNDYAEYRSGEITEPGRVVHECPDGIMRMSTKRLEPACEIISDTFGFAIGETDTCKTPIAATGRVLAYVDSNRYNFNLGDAVCSGVNGTVSKMTREEIMMYPERIIGTVSEIPEYETWGTGNVKVNGRIWIRIR